MEPYIKKSDIIAEIERLQCFFVNERDDFEKGYHHILRLLKSFLDTLETKEVDLENEMDKEWNNCEPIDEGMGLEIASIEHEQFDNIAKHFYELGLKAQKGE